MILGVPGVEVGTLNLSKIDQNLKPKMGCLLASIFDGFWWIFGGKLGLNRAKIDPKSIPKNIKQNYEKSVRLGAPRVG